MEIENGLILAIAGVITFLVTLATIPYLIKTLKEKGITGKDVHKKNVWIPEMGGLAVVLGFFSGFFFILFFLEAEYPPLIASCVALLGACILGIIDDLMELRQRIKGLLPFFFGLPLGFTVAQSFIEVPIIDGIEAGVLIYILVPLAITCAANATNMLEGFNGMSAGMNIIMALTLTIIALDAARPQTYYLTIPLLCALIVFLFFNKYPARIFPGDTLTLFAGAVIACAAIVSNLYFYALILYIPFIAEFMLKFFGKLRRSGIKNWNTTEWAQSFGTRDKTGHLRYDGPVESLTHLVMKKLNVKEFQLVFVFWGIELLFGLACVVIYFMVGNPGAP